MLEEPPAVSQSIMAAYASSGVEDDRKVSMNCLFLAALPARPRIIICSSGISAGDRIIKTHSMGFSVTTSDTPSWVSPIDT